MSRPPLAIGTWGEIRTYVAKTDDDGKPIRYRATTYYRDYDGQVKQFERIGRTKTAAKANLNKKLTQHSEAGRGGDLLATDRFNKAATAWIEYIDTQVQDGQRSPSTLETYQGRLKNHVIPALGALRIAEVTTPLLDRVLLKIKEKAGTATARSCRSAISGILQLCVRYGAITTNPIREAIRLEGLTNKEPRALTPDEIIHWFTKLDLDEKAREKDIQFLTKFLLATGVRIGEALAVLWSDVDLQTGSVRITSTIIRITGVGLLRVRTKSRAGRRTLKLPSWAYAILQQRFAINPRLDQPIFPDGLGGFRDPSNTRRALREARQRAGFDWLTSHNFRKTTATILDDAGLSARIAADQLGHARPSMTEDVYFARKVVDSRAANALENIKFSSQNQNHGVNHGAEPIDGQPTPN